MPWLLVGDKMVWKGRRKQRLPKLPRTAAKERDMKALHEETDKLNAALTAAETALAALGFGVSATVLVPGTQLVLAFGKYDGAWRLVTEFPNGAGVAWEPLVNGSREMRVSASKELPALLEALEARVATEEDAVRLARLDVERFTESLKRVRVSK